MRSKSDLLGDLTKMVGDSILDRRRGAAQARLTRLQGRIDGYMCALLDAGIVTRDELLALVSRERAKWDGPATGVCETANADQADQADTVAA